MMGQFTLGLKERERVTLWITLTWRENTQEFSAWWVACWRIKSQLSEGLTSIFSSPEGNFFRTSKFSGKRAGDWIICVSNPPRFSWLTPLHTNNRQNESLKGNEWLMVCRKGHGSSRTYKLFNSLPCYARLFNDTSTETRWISWIL